MYCSVLQRVVDLKFRADGIKDGKSCIEQVLQCVAVCCSVLQYCCVLQCFAVCCSVLQCMSTSMLQCVAVYKLQCISTAY